MTDDSTVEPTPIYDQLVAREQATWHRYQDAIAEAAALRAEANRIQDEARTVWAEAYEQYRDWEPFQGLEVTA